MKAWEKGSFRSGARAISLTAIAAAALLASENNAEASGYLVARFGADHGTPATPNPFAVYYNPAAMGGTEGTNLSLDVAPVLRLASYERTPDALGNEELADPSNQSDIAQRYRAANTGKAKLTNVLALGYLGLTTDLGLKKSPLRFGYAAYVPFGGIAQWDKRTDAIADDPLAPGAQDGVQRWHNINGKIFAIYNTLAVSLTVLPRFSVGANVSVVFHDIDTVRARNIPQNNDNLQGFDGRIQEGRTRLTAHGLNVGAAFGLYWEPLANRSVKLGASYTSSPGFGQMRLAGEVTAQDAARPQAAQPTKVEMLQTYPDIIRLGGAWRVSPRWEMRADFEYVRWSVFKQQCVVTPGADCNTNPDGSGADERSGNEIVLNIPRHFKDATGARAGAGFFVNPETEIFGSAGVTTSAVQKKYIDASTIDSTRLYLTLGARHEFSKHFALASSANWIHFFPVDTNGLHRTDQLSVPSRGPSANGIYKSEVFFLNVNGTYTF